MKIRSPFPATQIKNFQQDDEEVEEEGEGQNEDNDDEEANSSAVIVPLGDRPRPLAYTSRKNYYTTNSKITNHLIDETGETTEDEEDHNNNN